MSEAQVVELMKSSRSDVEWNANTDKVKEECGGYPLFWYNAIVASGLMGRVVAQWGSDDKIQIVTAKRIIATLLLTAILFASTYAPASAHKSCVWFWATC